MAGKPRKGKYQTFVSARGQVYLGIAHAGLELEVYPVEEGWVVRRVDKLRERETRRKREISNLNLLNAALFAKNTAE